MQERRIWVNVTTSENWNRPAVGIIRVEQKICEELEKIYPKGTVRKCVWVDNQFKELMEKEGNKNTDLFKQGDIFISLGLDWDYPYVSSFYEIKKKGIHVITICYDLIPILFPQLCLQNVAGKFCSYFIDVIEASSVVMCISKRTECDLKKFISETGSKDVRTEVIQLGNNFCNNTQISLNPNKEKFILYVSSIERRKNHEVLYKAYHILCSQGLKMQIPQLIFVGMPGWGVDDLIRDINEDPLTKGKITILNRVSDSDLISLYKNAIFCVYPSLYEGWGLPVCEALSLGRFVLCSNCGSLQEAGESYADYLDPWNPYDWAKAIYYYSTNLEKVRKKEKTIKNNYKSFSWRDTALQVKKVIESL